MSNTHQIHLDIAIMSSSFFYIFLVITVDTCIKIWVYFFISLNVVVNVLLIRNGTVGLVSLKNKPRNSSSGFKTSHQRLNGEKNGKTGSLHKHDLNGHSAKPGQDLNNGHQVRTGHDLEGLQNGQDFKEKQVQELTDEHEARNGHELKTDNKLENGHEVPIGIINRHEWRNDFLNCHLAGFQEEDTAPSKTIGDFGKIGDIGEFSRFSEFGSLNEFKLEEKGEY